MGDILLVEDNEDHIVLIKKALKDAGIVNNIYAVTDGQEALDYMYHTGKYTDETKAPRPDLILLDVKLPKVDGFEVLKKLKADPKYKTIPIIMLTTSARDEDIAKGYFHMANSYVTKPVNFEEFIKKVKEIPLYWLLTNTLPPKNTV